MEAPSDTNVEPLLAQAIREGVIESAFRANKGHIGSALSIADIVAAALSAARRLGEPDGDRVILSKGHAALALYVGLTEIGLVTKGQLSTYSTDGTPFGTHPDPEIRGVDLMTGSLGQGIAFAVGAAHGAQLRGLDRHTIAIVSDAELNEGSSWEALHIAQHHRLPNLSIIIDDNGQQAFGYTVDVQTQGDLETRLRAMNLDVAIIDGHDAAEMAARIRAHHDSTERPQVIVAKTTFGKGVSFMERSIPWHYMPLDEEHFERAIGELQAGTR